MGCGTVSYSKNTAEESAIPSRPYPETISGINDKVANQFNLFLKNHGAIPKPVPGTRPKLNFDLKDSKAKKSFMVSSMSCPEKAQNSNQIFFLSSISEKKSAEETYNKAEEKNFFINIPQEFNPEEVVSRAERQFRFSIKISNNDEAESLEISPESIYGSMCNN